MTLNPAGPKQYKNISGHASWGYWQVEDSFRHKAMLGRKAPLNLDLLLLGAWKKNTHKTTVFAMGG